MPLNFEKISQTRRALGLTTTELGRRCGFKTPYISMYRIETGRQQVVTLETIEVIAEVLGLSVIDLLQPAPPSSQDSKSPSDVRE